MGDGPWLCLWAFSGGGRVILLHSRINPREMLGHWQKAGGQTCLARCWMWVWLGFHSPVGCVLETLVLYCNQHTMFYG